MPAPLPRQLRDELSAYGILHAKQLRGKAKPEAVDYLDLISDESDERDDVRLLPDAVAENQDRPLLYVVNKANLSTDSAQYEIDLRSVRRSLGSRGERAYLGIIEPGHLTVLPISLDPKLPKPEVYEKGTGEALTFFSRLSLGQYKGTGEPTSPDYVYDEMFKLLENSADQLVRAHKLNHGDVLSLVGRALFFRFLCDRKIVKPGSLKCIAPSATNLVECFDTPENAADTCLWLDETFNGDFLPLTEKGALTFFKKIGQQSNGKVFEHLGAILHGHQPSGTGYQQVFEWAKFDFAHVPIGLLSQVYEAFSWKWSPDAQGTSVHYTPKRIADYLVEEAFHDLPKPEAARVLDPACGAGIFLVLAFRRLYQALWKAEGKRPDTAAIRKILETQLQGFDVSESALRLAALSLYLTAIELDPEPAPPSKLRFKNLRDRVLFNCRRPGIDFNTGPILGSLGEHVDKRNNQAFDLILCNPPWTSLSTDGVPPAEKEAYKPRIEELANQFTKLSQDVLTRRGLPVLAQNYQNPDNVPDLPFVWRSMEWCRPNGRIGMVLPGRNLFKQEPIPCKARETLFRAISVTGILNCSNLSDTKVWPEMNQPFFLLFACNRIPRANANLRWVTPHCDLSLNSKGEVRVDSKSVALLCPQATFQESWLWKALALGTMLDVDVVRRVKAINAPTLQEYWHGDLELVSSNGYQIKASQPQSDASFLKGMPDLNATDLFRFLVDVSRLDEFAHDTAFRPRNREVYRAPLVLVRGFPSAQRSRGLALLSFSDVVYNQSFHGYSAAKHAEGESLVRYIQLFVHSVIWQHYVLMTSPKIGVERREFYKTDLDSCLIIPFDRLDECQQKLVGVLSDRLIANDETVFEEIDSLFTGLYGLTKHDLEVIRDTLDTSLPYNDVRERACDDPTPEQKRAFAARVESLLRPFLRKLDEKADVKLWTPTSATEESAPYSVLLCGTEKRKIEFSEEFFCEKVLSLANETGASRVIFEVKNGLVIAVLNQQRYWTLSRARLCATEILQHHMTAFRR